ncbi:MAG: hypothetical protein WBF36_05190, partial [Desulfobulbales bacterium]
MFKTFLYNSFPQCTKALKYFLLLLFVLLIPALVKAQEMDSLEIAQKLQSTYEKALNLVADFKQT